MESMNESRSIRVIIADDQELVRAGFAMVIGSQQDMEVVAQASDGAEAVTMAETLHPDVVLMDVRMPGMDGIEATRRITSLTAGTDGTQPTRVIILTTFDLDEYVMAAINAGASGFLLKDTEPETLLNSIRTVFQGNAIIAPSATKRLIEKMMQDGYAQHGSLSGGVSNASFNGNAGGVADTTGTVGATGADSTNGIGTAHPTYTDPELELLTDREREVLVEIAHGLSNQEIADKLFISLPTVKTHVAHILAKINARDRVQAVVFAYDNGWYDLPNTHDTAEQVVSASKEVHSPFCRKLSAFSRDIRDLITRVRSLQFQRLYSRFRISGTPLKADSFPQRNECTSFKADRSIRSIRIDLSLRS